MTKSQLVDLIAVKLAHVPRKNIEDAVHSVFDAMLTALRSGQRIEIRGFGSFGVKARPARDGRNPKTGERVFVPRRRTVFFTVGKELKDRVNRMRDPSRVNTVVAPVAELETTPAEPIAVVRPPPERLEL